ncbi:MAG: alanine racemase [Oscillospiraceae bacterium]|nr:alanine racemase [Oscillospiraceae bacterium]
MRQLKRTWVEIDLDALAHNFNEIRRQVGRAVDIMAIVKADAYGHGAKQVAQTLQAQGADWFGVSNINEAKALRRYGVTKPILILGYTPEENVAELAQQNITQSVLGADYARSLSKAAAAAGVRPDVHIKLDTGMSRIGFAARDARGAADEIAAVCADAHLRVTGMFTHFAVADEPDSEESLAYTRRQHALFEAVAQGLDDRGCIFFHKHCCNSAGTLLYPEYYHEMVRPGLILYGETPMDAAHTKLDLRPVMTLKTVAALVKPVQKGECVSYGCTYTADADKVVATVPIGYADGYVRALSGKGLGYVGGAVVPVIGRVCMDQMMLDVTGVDVQEGDVVTLFGGGSPISLDNIAKIAGTISYELMCGISRRVQRVYVRGGKIVDVVDYTE